MDSPADLNRLGHALSNNRGAKLAEIALVFAVPLVFLLGTARFAGGDPLRFQALVWVANVMMLTLIWVGLRLRGEGWADIGTPFSKPDRSTALRTVGISVLVFIFAVGAFIVGAIVAANIFGMPGGGADTSEYGYMSGNLPMLMAALAAAWVVSSWGEEVVYRGFLINRFAELSASRLRWTPAVIGSAVLFGLAHFSWGPSGMVQTGFMGLALGIAYLRLKRNLWVTILAHAYMDTILFVQMYLGG